jgi:hypothetical protein
MMSSAGWISAATAVLLVRPDGAMLLMRVQALQQSSQFFPVAKQLKQ